jgi:predicted transcriptional regulator
LWGIGVEGVEEGDSSMKKIRDVLGIYYDILEATKKENIITHIMYKSNTSGIAIKFYLENLIKLGLVEKRILKNNISIHCKRGKQGGRNALSENPRTVVKNEYYITEKGEKVSKNLESVLIVFGLLKNSAFLEATA